MSRPGVTRQIMNNVGEKRLNLYCVKDTASRNITPFQSFQDKKSLSLKYSSNCGKIERFLASFFPQQKMSNLH